MADITNTKPKTGSQLRINTFDGTVIRNPDTPSDWTRWCKKVRIMREHPTIKMARLLAVAPIVEAGWNFEGEDDSQIEWLKEQLENRQSELLRTILLEDLNFGFCAAELELTPEGGIAAIKYLLADVTIPLRDPSTNEFLGLKTQDINLATGYREDVYILPEWSLFVACDEEALGGFGVPGLFGIEPLYDAWIEANAVAAMYDRKIAAGLGMFYVPEGKTPYKDGVETDNYTIAGDVIRAWENGRWALLPAQPTNLEDGKPVQGAPWTAHRIDAPGAQNDFNARLNALEKQIIRGILGPERMATEAAIAGSRADSESHADLALLAMQMRHCWVTEILNRYLVERILTLRFGEAKAHLCAKPLSDDQKAYYKGLINKAIEKDIVECVSRIDWDVALDASGVAIVKGAPAQEYVDPAEKMKQQQELLPDQIPPQQEANE